MYNSDRVTRLRNIIEDLYEPQYGKGKKYCILIDDEIVVPHTSDPSKFDNYKKHMDHQTQKVEVRMYYGSSRHCNRHVFQVPNPALHGVPEMESIEDQVQAALEEERFNTYVKGLEKENKQLKKALEKAESQCEDVTARFEEFRERKPYLDMLAGFVGNKLGVPIPVGDKPVGSPPPGEPVAEVEVEPINQTPQVSQAAASFDRMIDHFGLDQDDAKKLLQINEIILQDGELHKIIEQHINANYSQPANSEANNNQSKTNQNGEASI